VIAALLVLRSHHDAEATLQIIGKPATTSYGQALHRYVAQLGLQSAVTFTGHASDVGVLRAYGEADVLVVASDHEGFCVPVTEAMAAGLPIVAFAAGALPEVVGEAGVLVESRDPYDLAGAIHALVRDEARQAELRRAGVSRLDVLDLASAADRIIAAVATSGRPEQSKGSRVP
jgi:glycosyltransferase involved in cell wall biosynthesis